MSIFINYEVYKENTMSAKVWRAFIVTISWDPLWFKIFFSIGRVNLILEN